MDGDWNNPQPRGPIRVESGTITLLGGPADGRRYTFAHGRQVTIMDGDRRAIYERSTVNPSIFVWQGWPEGTREAVDFRQAHSDERLVDLLCLADEALMLSHGCFPLDKGPLRDACLLIRATTGEDYKVRTYRAARARREAQ